MMSHQKECEGKGGSLKKDIFECVEGHKAKAVPPSLVLALLSVGAGVHHVVPGLVPARKPTALRIAVLLERDCHPSFFSHHPRIWLRDETGGFFPPAISQ